MSFEPFKVEESPLTDSIVGVQLDRYTANDTLVGDDDYEWDKSFKPAAGAVQSGFSKIVNTHTVDMVRGQIVLRAALSDADYDYICKYYPDTELFSADLIRKYDGKDTTVGTFTITTPEAVAADLTGGKYLYATFVPAGGTAEELKDMLLPTGDYKFDNITPNTDLPLEFEEIALVEDLADALGQFNNYVYLDSSGKMQTASLGNTVHKASYTTDGKIQLGTARTDASRLNHLLGLAEVKGTLKTGSLTISKTVKNESLDFTPDPDKEYSFRVKFFLNGTPLSNISVSINGAPAAPFGGTVVLKDGEKAEISGIPAGVTYTVEEITVGNFKADYDYSDKAEVKLIENDDSDEVAVTNTYTGAASGTATFTVKKTIENIEWDDLDGKKFTFTLAPVGGNPEGATVTVCDAEGNKVEAIELSSGDPKTFKINFDDISFEEGETQKVYNFTLKENLPETNPYQGLTYDTKEYNIEVTVKYDENGKIDPTVNITLNGVPKEIAEFTNKYEPAPVTLPISVSKVLDGWQDEEFTFEIALTIGDPSKVTLPEPTSVNVTKDIPTVSFGNITFTDEGTYIFTISEVNDGNDNIIYAETQIVTVNVRQEGGKLTVYVNDNVEPYDGSNPPTLIFTNYYKTPGTPDNPPTTSPEETTDPNETTSPDETTDPNETTSPDETTDPNETTSPDETTDPNETTSPDETTDPNETTSPEETTDPNETTSPKETTAPEVTTSPEETTAPEVTTSPEETTPPEVTTKPEEIMPPAATGSLTLRKVLLVDGIATGGGRTFTFRIELLNSSFTGVTNGVRF